MTKESFMKMVKICERAEKEFPTVTNLLGNRPSRMMDLESADQRFNLRLDDLLTADDENFFHDILGIWSNSNRETYPCTFGLFVPRFSGR